MHWQIHKDGRVDYLLADGKLEVAVALGLDPVTAYAASAPLPQGVEELIRGVPQGEAVELVPCKTVQLEVPANAEIVLEGYIAKEELTRRPVRRPHRLLLAWPSRFRPSTSPRSQTAGTPFTRRRRRQAAGRRTPASARRPSGSPAAAPDARARHRRLLPPRRRRIPQLRIVAIRKRYPFQAQKVMHAIWGLGLLSLTKARRRG